MNKTVRVYKQMEMLTKVGSLFFFFNKMIYITSQEVIQIQLSFTHLRDIKYFLSN